MNLAYSIADLNGWRENDSILIRVIRAIRGCRITRCKTHFRSVLQPQTIFAASRFILPRGRVKRAHFAIVRSVRACLRSFSAYLQKLFEYLRSLSDDLRKLCEC
jgi:hypothetical protein